MPIKQASFKSLRQTKKRTARRARVAGELEMFVKKMKRQLEAKNKTEAPALAVKVQKMIDKAAKKKVIAKNKANRLKSRLMKALAKL